MLLFEYAKLMKPGFGKPAAAPGVLRWKGDDGAGRFSAKNSTLIKGKVVDFTEAELKKLDAAEAPRFSRVNIVLDDGRKAYAYEYMPDDWNDLPINKTGAWTRGHKGK